MYTRVFLHPRIKASSVRDGPDLFVYSVMARAPSVYSRFKTYAGELPINHIPLPMSEPDDEVLLAEFGVSRTLVLQWTAVSTLGFVIAVVGFLVLYYAITGDETATELTVGLASDGVWWWSLALSFLALVVLMALVVLPHEFCHGLAIRAFGGQPRYGLGVTHFVFPYAFATTDTRLTRNQFIIVASTPLVVLTLLGLPLMILLELPWLAVPLALNAGGAVGDVSEPISNNPWQRCELRPSGR